MGAFSCVCNIPNCLTQFPQAGRLNSYKFSKMMLFYLFYIFWKRTGLSADSQPTDLARTQPRRDQASSERRLYKANRYESNNDMIVIDKRWGGEMCCVCFATPRRGREWEARGGEKRGRRRDFLPVPPTALFLCTAHPVREQLSRFLPLIIVNTWTFLNGPGPAHLKAVWENTALQLLSFVLESVLIMAFKTLHDLVLVPAAISV